MEVFIFYFFALLTTLAALGVFLHPNPVICALHLVASMIGVAGLFFILQAPFIAGVQLLVYAGAVMVLFLIVVMLFDLRDNQDDFSPGKIANGFKVLLAGMFTGLLTSTVLIKLKPAMVVDKADNLVGNFDVRVISKYLFTEYMFAFEVLGVLLLVIPIGAVALSRIRGGTHAK